MEDSGEDDEEFDVLVNDEPIDDVSFLNSEAQEACAGSAGILGRRDR